MLMALTAVAVMACRVCPVRQVTTATALASLRKASFVCAASCSFRGSAACMRYLPARYFVFDTVPYCTLQRTVRYSKCLIRCNRKVRGATRMTRWSGNLKSIQDPKASAPRRPRGTARGPGRVETAEQRRERIVRLVLPLFLKKGYDNVSIDDIIGVVGGSKATIYTWFGGKDGLFEAVVRQKCQEVVLAIHVDPAGNLEAQLTEIGHS